MRRAIGAWVARSVLLAAGALLVGGALSMAAPAAAQEWVGGSPLVSRVRVGANGDTYVGVWIQAPQIATPSARAPMAVSLVIDTSGSMAGDKIRNAQLAASSLVESLRDGDVVSIYAFSNQVTQIAPPTVMNAAARSMLMQGIGGLYAGGGTNLYDGMQVGVQRMREAPATHPLRRIFLISDGMANIGPSDPQSLGDLAARSTEYGTQVTAIGVGYDYDQRTLHAMAVQSSGRLYHLAQPQQMASILEGELDLMARSVALNAVLEVVPASGVTILAGETTGATVQNGRLRFPLGAMHAGQEREVLFRARLDTRQLGNRPLADARILYQEPGRNTQRTSHATLSYEVARDAPAAPTPRVAAMVANHTATRAQERAAEAMRQGQQAQAVQELERARTVLATAAAAAPPRSAAGDALLRRSSRMESQREQAAGAASPAVQQQRAYDFADEAASAEGY